MSRDTFGQGGNFIKFNADFKAEVTYGRYSDIQQTEQFTGIKSMYVRIYDGVYDFTFCSDHNDTEQSVLLINSSDFISLKLEKE